MSVIQDRKYYQGQKLRFNSFQHKYAQLGSRSEYCFHLQTYGGHPRTNLSPMFSPLLRFSSKAYSVSYFIIKYLVQIGPSQYCFDLSILGNHRLFRVLSLCFSSKRPSLVSPDPVRRNPYRPYPRPTSARRWSGHPMSFQRTRKRQLKDERCSHCKSGKLHAHISGADTEMLVRTT